MSHADSARARDDAGSDDLAHHLLRVVEEGRRTGTRKFMLLLALLDVVTKGPRKSIPVRELAHPILEQLWQQVSDFVPPGGAAPGPLRQMRPNGRGKFKFWELTADARRQSERLGLADLTELDRERQDVVEQLEAGVVAAAVKNPIPRFQRIDGDLIEFLSHWPWGTDRSPRAVAQAQGRADDEPHLEFVAGAADRLRGLEPVLRPVVEDQMVLDVATYNNLHTSTEAVRDHLFGTNRWAIVTAGEDVAANVDNLNAVGAAQPGQLAQLGRQALRALIWVEEGQGELEVAGQPRQHRLRRGHRGGVGGDDVVVATSRL